MDNIIFLLIKDYNWSCMTNILQVFCDQAVHDEPNLVKKKFSHIVEKFLFTLRSRFATEVNCMCVLICLDFGQLSSF